MGIRTVVLDKARYSLEEASKLTNVPRRTILFWETKFDELIIHMPEGKKLVTQENIKMILLIKFLLRTELYTMKGAMRQIKMGRKIYTRSHANRKNRNKKDPEIFKSV